MLKKISVVLGGAFFLLCISSAVWSKMTPDEIARLDKDLTPMGAERAGNKDGTIPAWTGGILKAPEGYQPGMHHPDPYGDDQVLTTITAANMDQYADKLSEGHKAMLKTYGSFKMKVYPTRRSASFPQRIYDITRQVAATAEVVDGGNGVKGCINGIPFPIPKNGLEVIWNHLLRYRGENVVRRMSQAMPTRSGAYTLVGFADEANFIYSQEGMTEDKLNNMLLLFKQKVLSPARLAGGILLVHETLDQVKQPRSAWLYNPGQRRVRRAPQVGYDNPGTASDGMRTNDQFDMFSGATDRYEWTLVGKREIYVPYNSYILHSDSLKCKDILTPLHINPELCRYELHRTWVVKATVKEGARHIYKSRTFYFDEDSWQILIMDLYDNRDQLWRVSEGHVVNYYEVPTLFTTLEVHTDLQAGRYLAIGLDNESSMYDFDAKLTMDEFTPGALRREGRR